MLKTFVSKSILYVYQNANEFFLKLPPKLYKMYPKKNIFLCNATPI
jgi:hypothetical protein